MRDRHHQVGNHQDPKPHNQLQRRIKIGHHRDKTEHLGLRFNKDVHFRRVIADSDVLTKVWSTLYRERSSDSD